MVYAILRTGKVIRYNDANAIVCKDGSYHLQGHDGSSLVAMLPLDIVERVEFNRPCKVMKLRKRWTGGCDY